MSVAVNINACDVIIIISEGLLLNYHKCMIYTLYMIHPTFMPITVRCTYIVVLGTS